MVKFVVYEMIDLMFKFANIMIRSKQKPNFKNLIGGPLVLCVL